MAKMTALLPIGLGVFFFLQQISLKPHPCETNIYVNGERQGAPYGVLLSDLHMPVLNTSR